MLKQKILSRLVKVYCKRTFFERNDNTFSVNGKESGQYYVKWAGGEIYECHAQYWSERKKWQLYDNNNTYLINSEVEESWYPVSKKNFNKYFETLDEYRNKKIEQILKND